MKREQQPLLWLGILILASLRSPFLPGYGIIPVVWLLTLLGATVAPTAKTAWLVLLAWLCLNAAAWQAIQDPRLLAGLILLPQAAIAILIVLLLRNRPDLTMTRPPDLTITSPVLTGSTLLTK